MTDAKGGEGEARMGKVLIGVLALPDSSMAPSNRDSPGRYFYRPPSSSSIYAHHSTAWEPGLSRINFLYVSENTPLGDTGGPSMMNTGNRTFSGHPQVPFRP